MTYTFLVLDLLLLLLPCCLLFDRKTFTVALLKSAILPSFIVTIIYAEVAVFFVDAKVWAFNSLYLVGAEYRHLPLEAYLFVFAFSFSGLTVYNYLNAKFPKNDLQKYSLVLSNLLLGVLVAILYFSKNKWFPVITVSMLLVLVLSIEYLNKLRFMYRFYRAFAACLVLYYACFAVICNLPIITYQRKETMGVYLANIPFENHVYTMGMLLLGVYFIEYLKHRKAN